jgi:hypothetical protein
LAGAESWFATDNRLKTVMKKLTILSAAIASVFSIQGRAVVISETEFDLHRGHPFSGVGLYVGFVDIIPPLHSLANWVFEFGPPTILDVEDWQNIYDEVWEDGWLRVDLAGAASALLFANSSTPGFKAFTAQYMAGEPVYLGTGHHEYEEDGGFIHRLEPDYSVIPIIPPHNAEYVITGYKLDVHSELLAINNGADFVTRYTGTFTVLGLPESGATAGLLGIGVTSLLVLRNRHSRGSEVSRSQSAVGLRL